jgi:hypothetical protein
MLAVLMDYDYVFTENGLVAFKDGKLIGHEVEHSSSAGCLAICNPF